jgi:hypothetical protein
MSLIENVKRREDMPMCIAAATVAENIIADICQYYLFFKGKRKRHVSTKVLIEKCGTHFKKSSLTIKPKSGKVIECEDLFSESQLWLKVRNHILHGFTKSKLGKGAKNIVEFHNKSIDADENGLRLVNLNIKWH